MQKPVSVSRLTQTIKNTLEISFEDISVEGEISNYKEHSSGHRYFTLKDANAQIACTMWKGRHLGFVPKDGMKAVVSGSVTVYAPRGNYQIDVSSMLPAGKGDLYLAFEALKAKLSEAGYFDDFSKKPLPTLPLSIGISTSPTGAAVQDMLTTIERRFPKCTVYFRPTLVQGEGSAEDIVRAINELEQTNADVIIIGRGGGSIEDLWSYNTEIVANAIFNCQKPIISAVGHETDFTIADFVADCRAATPTAAAELVTPYLLEDVEQDLKQYSNYLYKTLKNHINSKKNELGVSFGKHINKMVKDKIRQYVQLLDSTDLSGKKILTSNIKTSRNKVEYYQKLLSSFHPLSPLSRGFAVVRSGGEIIKPDVPLSKFKKVEILRKYDAATVKIEKIYPPDLFMVSQNE